MRIRSAVTVIGLLVPSAVNAATLTVPSGPYPRIQSAIDAAAAGDVIQVAPGSYAENIDINGKSLTITGVGGSGVTEIRPDDWTVVSIRNGAVVTFTGFEIDTRDVGQGFHIDRGTATLSDVHAHGQDNDGNTRSGLDSGGGAYIVNGSTVSITASVFEDNNADGRGGGIYVNGSALTVTGTRFEADSSVNGGGGIAAEGIGSVVLNQVTFVDNSSDNSGGGLYVDGTIAVTLTGVQFERNDARRGGGAHVHNATVTSTSSDFDANQANEVPSGLSLQGGARWTGNLDAFGGHGRGAVLVGGAAQVALTGASFTGNTSGVGGALAITSTGAQSVTTSVFTANGATANPARGGAIAFTPTAATASLVVSRSDFATNTASGGASTGGALYLGDGQLTLTDTTFTDNRAAAGGAAYTTGSDALTVTRGLVCANDATAGAGGGFYIANATGAVDVRNVVFTENTATQSGGGLYVTGGTAAIGVTNDTFTGNTGGQGGAAYFALTGFTFRNNIVWRSAGNGVSADPTVFFRTYSLVYGVWFLNNPANLGDGLASTTLATSNLLLDPLLYAFVPGDQSCSSDRLTPKVGSPAINGGDPGLLDPDGSRSDVGAFGGPSAAATMFVDGDKDGTIAVYDCNDTNAAIRPGATESCNLADDDCDGLIDEAGSVGEVVVYLDSDGDGYGNALTSTKACPGVGGYVATGTDCNDANKAINPLALEICDFVDNDCDGLVDEPDAADARAWYPDADKDGYGDASKTTKACAQPAGSVASAGDCNDASAAANPGVVEVCDGIDNNCDGTIDVNVTAGTQYYADTDGDGYGDPGKGVIGCNNPPGYVTNSIDCNDTDGAVNPNAAERCNGVDDNCDKAVDPNTAIDATVWYQDADSDGWGDTGKGVTQCAAPTGYVAQSGDCDDTKVAYNPLAKEVCTDPADYNCDGSTGTADGDADGAIACEDCDDADAAVYPGATEVCNTVDDDCDAVIDEADAVGTQLWYPDTDRDGFGDPVASVLACFAPSGYVGDGTDCNDTNWTYRPGAPELCNVAVDFNCDGASGSVDNDLDGVLACNECDDFDPTVQPGADEVCDGSDNDCDGATDEDGVLFGESWFADGDGDGFGNANAAQKACVQPDAHVADDSDCEDGDAGVNPDATDIPGDGIDQDCDGVDAPSGEDTDTEDTISDTDTLDDTDVDPKGGGCNCDSTPGVGGASTWLVGLVGLLLARRRSRRG